MNLMKGSSNIENLELLFRKNNLNDLINSDQNKFISCTRHLICYLTYHLINLIKLNMLASHQVDPISFILAKRSQKFAFFTINFFDLLNLIFINFMVFMCYVCCLKLIIV